MSDGSPKLVAMDEEVKHQIVHRGRFGKAHGTTDSPLNPGAHIDVLALDFLRVLFADGVLLGGEMPLVGLPPIGVQPCRSIYHTLSRVKSGGGTAYLLSVAGLIACKDASLFEAFLCPWTPPSTYYKLL